MGHTIFGLFVKVARVSQVRQEEGKHAAARVGMTDDVCQ